MIEGIVYGILGAMIVLGVIVIVLVLWVLYRDATWHLR